MHTAGYSGTTLAKKLGIKPGFAMRVVNGPEYYFELFTDLPDHLRITNEIDGRKNLIHYFNASAAGLRRDLPDLKKEIQPDGMIWISWPKKAAKVVTDITEDVIREVAAANGLVDVKVCAVDATWSGLKLVIPLKDRTG